MNSNNAHIRSAVFERPFNKKLIERLDSKERDVVTISPFTLDDCLSTSSDEIFIAEGVEMLVLTDIFAVDILLGVFEQKSIDPYSLDSVRICALGESVADRLRFDQIHADIIPTNNSSQQIAGSIEDFFGVEINKIRTQIIGGDWAQKEMGRCFGDQVPFVKAYKTTGSEGLTRMRTLMVSGAFDELVLGSAIDVLNLSIMFQKLILTQNDIGEMQILTFDGLAYQSARECGLNPKGVPR